MGDNDVVGSNKGSASVSTQVKGIRNRRKYITDLLFNAPMDISASPVTDDTLHNTLLVNLRAWYRHSDKEQNVNQYEQAEDDPLVPQFEELLKKKLLVTLQSAIKKVTECGFDEQTAESLVLRNGIPRGSKDLETDIVDGALALSKRPYESDTSKDLEFESLETLVEHTVLELIRVLREVKPSLTVSEAMWYLFLFDLDVSLACAANGGHSGGSVGPSILEEKLVDSRNGQLTQASSVNRHEIPKVGIARQLSSSRYPWVRDAGKICKEGSVTLLETAPKSSCIIKGRVQTSTGTSVDKKFGGGRKGLSVLSRLDTLREKALHMEKISKGKMSKGSFKEDVSALEMVWNQTLKAASGSSGIIMSSTSSKITTSTGANTPLCEESGVTSPAVNAQIPATLEVEPGGALETIPEMPSSSLTQQDAKDEILLLLFLHMHVLEKELQCWSDWANEKIVQVTSRLKTLKREQEEAERSEKEKQICEEKTIKRISEMEHAWSSADSQIDVATSTLVTLEIENSTLRLQKEIAKLKALESAASLKEAIRREQEAEKNAQSWGSKRSSLQEEFTSLKRNSSDLKRQLEMAEGRFKQIEALQKKVEKEADDALSKAKDIRARKEQQEALLKEEEDKITKKSESNIAKCREQIQKLETQIAVLKFESDSSRIKALCPGINMDYGNVSLDNKSAAAFLGLKSPTSSKRLPVFRDNFGAKNVKRERECVMCLTEEMSVVFLPCAHQVICAECNVLHEKQGMNDCPSCRTKIQRRVKVQFANS